MDKVIIKKIDEAHNKIVCDPGIIMELSSFFTFDVPGAKFSPAYRNKVWDGKIRLLNTMSCLLYAGLAEHVETFCRSRDYDVEYEGITSDYEFSLVEAEAFIKKLNPTHYPRDYQIEAFVHAVRKRRAMLLSPTASGKSLIIYLLTCWYAKKTLIIVPTTSLVHQMTSDFEDYGFPKNAIHKIMSGQEKHSERMIFCSTWQSIYKMPKAWFDQFDVVIGDEAHLFKSKSLISIMTGLRNCPHRFGFTGTLDGSQTHKLVLEGLFGPVRKIISTSELIEKKHLADFRIKAIILKYSDDIRKINIKNDYQTEMDFLVRNDSRNKFIKNLVLSLKGNTLLLFQYVDKHGKVLYDMLQKEAVDRNVYFISGSVDGEKREEIRKSVDLAVNGIILKFQFGELLLPENLPVLLETGEIIEAKNITTDTDISEKWLSLNKDLYKYQ